MTKLQKFLVLLASLIILWFSCKFPADETILRDYANTVLSVIATIYTITGLTFFLLIRNDTKIANLKYVLFLTCTFICAVILHLASFVFDIKTVCFAVVFFTGLALLAHILVLLSFLSEAIIRTYNESEPEYYLNGKKLNRTQEKV